MIDEEKIFAEAQYYWDLDKIYERFAKVKQEVAPNSRKGLNPTEKLYLRSLLCGHTPTEIAKNLVKSPKGVEVYLCKTLYKYFKKITNMADSPEQNTGSRHSIPHWSETEGYRLRSFSQSQTATEQELEQFVKLTIMNFNQNSGTIDIKVSVELPPEWRQKNKVQS
ncbi:MAG: hypothetical protein AUK48_09910 [Oscillatoriales cyanobacterium CG2_30_44_21]|nr:MAG: hypothetical protein AUK48_09910 [Oscillatoriales cyanobacterium CG2_30_44_21]